MNQEIIISTKDINKDAIIEYLESLPEWDQHNIKLELRKKESTKRLRAVDSTVIVAIITAGFGTIGILINALSNCRREKENRKQAYEIELLKQSIEVKLPNGFQIKCPYSARNELEAVLPELRKVMESPTIEVR